MQNEHHPDKPYMLATGEKAVSRLDLSERIFGPATRHLLSAARLCSGMRVAEVGLSLKARGSVGTRCTKRAPSWRHHYYTRNLGGRCSPRDSLRSSVGTRHFAAHPVRRLAPTGCFNAGGLTKKQQAFSSPALSKSFKLYCAQKWIAEAKHGIQRDSTSGGAAKVQDSR